MAVSQATPHIPTHPLQSQLVNWALALWVVGVWVFLFKLLIGFIATTLLTRRAGEFADPLVRELFSSLLSEVGLQRKVRLLRSERTTMPIVYGIFRPAVLLPAEAEAWTEERRRMVLLHELTHITRRDCLTQMLAQVACAFYWFNPLVWYAVHRLRVEREQACDDYVLSIGTKPSDYANHLLEIARSMQERSMFEWSHTATVAMARRSQLEGRLLSILSKENKRGAMSRALTLGLLTLICVLLLALAAIHPTPIHAQNQATSPYEATSEKESDERSLPDSFAVAGARRMDEMGAQGVSAHETVRRQGETTTLVGSPQGKTVHKEELEKGTGQNLQDAFERTVERESIEAPAQQSATVVQMPEVKLSTGEEANFFIKAGHKQEQTRQTQNRSGDFIDEMAEAGYTNLSVDELIRLKTSGVNADYVRSLRALGFTNLTSKELASLSIHRVTTAYIQAIHAAGYNKLSAKELTTFRIHNISPEYIKTLREAGHGNLEAKQLTEFAVHGVTPAFINAIRASGYGNLSPKELVSLRVHGVTPDLINRARGRLGELTIKQIISLKNMGMLADGKSKEQDKEKN
jgi:beta-lactamase regulating signal transducer with metallopeptidase domain